MSKSVVRFCCCWIAIALSLAVGAIACADDRPGRWCAPPSTSEARSADCALMDAVAARNRAGDYSANCLLLSYCAAQAAASPLTCPADLSPLLAAVRRQRHDSAISALETVCWETVEATWQERASAAHFVYRQFAGSVPVAGFPFSDAPIANEALFTAWTMDRAATVRPRIRYVLRYENDTLTGSDSNYTMGLSLSAIREGWPTEGWLQVPVLRGLGGINQLLSFDRDGIDATATTWWRFGSADFTPKRIKVPEIQANDTPYASLLFFASGYSEGDGPGQFDSFLEFGILGTNVGREVQTAIHKVCCQQNIPRGWDHQIGDGGSPTFRYHAQWSRAIAERIFENGVAVELRPSAGGEVGYYTRAIAGATLSVAGAREDLAQVRNGLLSGLETHLPEPAAGAPTPTFGREGAVAAPPPDSGSGFSLWAEFEASAVAYNQLLQGAWSGHNDLTYSYDEMEHFVWRSGVGIELTFLEKRINPWHVKGGRLFLTRQARSRELVHGREGLHTWGGIYYSWSF